MPLTTDLFRWFQSWLELASRSYPVPHKEAFWSLRNSQVQQRCQGDTWKNKGMPIIIIFSPLLLLLTMGNVGVTGFVTFI